uniref:7TM_GPCR_Srx domain-containing protein n=1 Tax=Haemonchus contortus TaxID=6289 RepID=A0A7I4YK33_HAECO
MVDFEDFHTLAGVLTAVMSSMGMVSNAYVFVSVIRPRKSRSSFLMICASKALFNFLTCVTFLVWCAPTAFLSSHYSSTFVGIVIGNFFGGTLYLGGVLTQVLASVNRVIASFSIHAYNRFCTLRNTTILIILCWIGTFSLAVAYDLNGIGYVFHEDYLVWGGDGQPQSADAFAYVGIMVYASTATMFTLNVVTFAKLLAVTRSNTVLSNTESTKRMKRNKVLLAQKVSQDSLYLIDMLFAQVLASLLPYIWWSFLCLTFVWLSLNAIDGMVMILFVKELSEPLRQLFQRIPMKIPLYKKSRDEMFQRRKSRLMSVATVSNSGK